MMGVTLAAGGSLQWFRNALCEADVAKAKRQKKDIYDLLVEEGAKVAPGAEGLMFLPYLAGERTPHADPLARGAFVGLTLRHTRAHMIRAVMEGVTYSLRDSLAIVQELGIPVRQVRTTGGGAKSAFWRQMQADMFGKRVVAMAAEEGPAYGVALLAAVGAGEYKSVVEACKATVKTTQETKPDAKTRRYYNQGFPIYQNLYHALRNDFQNLGGLG